MDCVFEKVVEPYYINFVNCTDTNTSRLQRFNTSPVILAGTRLSCNTCGNPLIQIHQQDQFQTLSYRRYVIATGVAHSPPDWCGPDNTGIGRSIHYPDRLSLFELLNEQYLTDLQAGRAFLLIDQSHEGYQTGWLWSWFHNNFTHHQINPKQVIYVTGNLDAEENYKNWIATHGLINSMKVVPYAHFEHFIYETVMQKIFLRELVIPTVDDHIAYKTENKDNIKTYNALQKRTRAHRAWLFKSLVESDLLSDGINTMNSFNLSQTHMEHHSMIEKDVEELNALLPLLPTGDKSHIIFPSSNSGSFLARLNEQEMLDSWVSVISEASFCDVDQTCFISEKSFKPIACRHPFIIFGNKHSLRYLRKLGYKTFSPFINEEYDELPTWERLGAIIKELKRINSMTFDEKIKWYSDMTDILNHNYNTLSENSKNQISLKLISNYVQDIK